jgi:hypothetical protein
VILVREGRVHASELVVTEMLDQETGVTWQGPLIPMPIRDYIKVSNKKYQVSDITVICGENKTVFEAKELQMDSTR